MHTGAEPGEPVARRASFFVLYLIGGLLIFLFGSNTFNTYPTNRNVAYEWGLTLVLLALMLMVRRTSGLRVYWQLAFALFAASFANSLNLLLGNWLGGLLQLTTKDAQFIAVDKFSQASVVVLSLLVLTKLSGNDLGSIFLKKGNLRQGMRFGLISFAVFSAIFIGIVILQSQGPSNTGLLASGVSVGTIAAAIPFVLIFVFANGFMEELWFRGISLGPLEAHLGTAATVLVTSLVFASLHLGVPYVGPTERLFFWSAVFTLGVVNAIVMLKTESIWGSTLFHAGYDLLVIIPILVAVQ